MTTRATTRAPKLRRLEPTEQRGDIPDWINRIYWRTCSGKPFAGLWGTVELIGARARAPGGGGPPVADLTAASRFQNLLRNPADTNPDFSWRPHQRTLWTDGRRLLPPGPHY